MNSEMMNSEIPAPSTYGTMYYVNNMAESVAFYKKMGLTPGYESPEWTEFPMKGHSLCLHAKAPGKTYRENGVLIVSANGVKSLYEKMKQVGFDVFQLHEVHPAAWSFHMKDLDQNETSFFGAP